MPQGAAGATHILLRGHLRISVDSRNRQDVTPTTATPRLNNSTFQHKAALNCAKSEHEKWTFQEYTEPLSIALIVGQMTSLPKGKFTTTFSKTMCSFRFHTTSFATSQFRLPLTTRCSASARSRFVNREILGIREPVCDRHPPCFFEIFLQWHILELQIHPRSFKNVI